MAARRRTRVSDHYKLGLQQPSLEFVDVVLEADTRLFVDPRAFVTLKSAWGDECSPATPARGCWTLGIFFVLFWIAFWMGS